MVASVPIAPTKRSRKCAKRDSGAAAVCEWRLVDHFNTVEDAERLLDELRNEGVDAEVSLIDGLSVIARRPHCPIDPHS